MQKVIIDTDPGCDDALAIMLAVKSKQLDILGLTCCAGNVPVELATRNAKAVLDLLARNDIPVHSGAARPLERELASAVVHGDTGLGAFCAQGEPKCQGNAKEFLKQTCSESPGEITLICLGPLTNIALALQECPQLENFIKELVILGGTYLSAGNKGPVSEYNFFVDPEAAQIVLKSKIKKTLVTLDACMQVVMQPEDFLSITQPTLKNAIIQMLTPYAALNADEEGIAGAIMYDPLAVYFLLQPGSAEACEAYAQVETIGKLTRGMCVVDRRLAPKSAPNIRLVTRMDPPRFCSDLINILNTANV
jgi:purine nucleosidase